MNTPRTDGIIATIRQISSRPLIANLEKRNENHKAAIFLWAMVTIWSMLSALALDAVDSSLNPDDKQEYGLLVIWIVSIMLALTPVVIFFICHLIWKTLKFKSSQSSTNENLLFGKTVEDANADFHPIQGKKKKDTRDI